MSRCCEILTFSSIVRAVLYSWSAASASAHWPLWSRYEQIITPVRPYRYEQIITPVRPYRYEQIITPVRPYRYGKASHQSDTTTEHISHSSYNMIQFTPTNGFRLCISGQFCWSYTRGHMHDTVVSQYRSKAYSVTKVLYSVHTTHCLHVDILDVEFYMSL